MKHLFVIVIIMTLSACQNHSGDPALATRPYPMELHFAGSVDIQVIHTNEFLEIVNSTADDYSNATIWINQRFSGSLEPLPAGSTLRLNLWSLRDSFGEQFNAGGIWRTDEPTTVVIAELQIGTDTPLIGLIVIGQE
jgi:hypothetical protein